MIFRQLLDSTKDGLNPGNLQYVLMEVYTVSVWEMCKFNPILAILSVVGLNYVLIANCAEPVQTEPGQSRLLFNVSNGYHLSSLNCYSDLIFRFI